MKSVLLVMLLAAAAPAAIVSNEVPDMVEVPDVDEVADVDVNEIPEVFVTYVDELTDAAELTDELEELAKTAVDSRRNMNLGNVTSEDTRIYDRELQIDGYPGVSLMRTYLVSPRQPITAIRVNYVGVSQNATPSITAGGIGNTFVLITIQTAVGRGFHYRVEVYVR